MKNRNILTRLGDFVLGKGFYIVLFLCVATIGISGYYLIQTMTGPVRPGEAETQTAGGTPEVILPDSEANGPEPEGTPEPKSSPIVKPDTAGTSPASGQKPEETTPAPVQDPQPDDPEAVHQTAAPAEVPAPEDSLPASYTWPVRGEVLREFSVDVLSPDPTLGDWRTHGGLDVACVQGSTIIALADGTVTQVYNDGLMGNTVMIEHGGGLTSVCCGLADPPTVSAGDPVRLGDVIGSSGNTAMAESKMPNHIHIETWLDGSPVDPLNYLPDLH